MPFRSAGYVEATEHTAADHATGGTASLAAIYASLSDPMGLGVPATVHPGGGGATSSFVANRVRYGRVTTGGGTIGRLLFQVVTSAGNVQVGVYTNTGTGENALPAALRVASQWVPMPAAGVANVALDASVAVRPGNDWFAITASDGAATGMITSGIADNLHRGFGTQESRGGFGLPANAGAGVADNVAAYVIVGRT